MMLVLLNMHSNQAGGQADRLLLLANCSDLERQQVQDKDKWKKEMTARLKDTKERMQRLTENQLETLTKRTILENEQMDAELRYQSHQVPRAARSKLFCA